MNHTLIISLCFLPIAIIFLVTKISLWVFSSVSEVKYVEEDARRPHGPYLEDAYGDVDAKDEADASW